MPITMVAMLTIRILTQIGQVSTTAHILELLLLISVIVFMTFIKQPQLILAYKIVLTMKSSKSLKLGKGKSVRGRQMSLQIRSSCRKLGRRTINRQIFVVFCLKKSFVYMKINGNWLILSLIVYSNSIQRLLPKHYSTRSRYLKKKLASLAKKIYYIFSPTAMYPEPPFFCWGKIQNDSHRENR